jgi:hypothetical protein
VLLTEIDCVPLLPTVTLPKFTLAGLALNCATGAAIPDPFSVTEVGLFDALLTSEICPEALPVAVGENFAV